MQPAFASMGRDGRKRAVDPCRSRRADRVERVRKAGTRRVVLTTRNERPNRVVWPFAKETRDVLGPSRGGRNLGGRSERDEIPQRGLGDRRASGQLEHL